MTDLQNKILQYLKTTKEASVYEIQAGVDLWTYNPLTQIRNALSELMKAGEIKRGAPSKYRIATKQTEDKQINLF
jgi:hypothetical protein